MRILIVAGMSAAAFALSACGGSTGDSASPAPPATSAAAVTPVAADDPCGLLSADELNQVLGTTFGAGEASTDDAREIADCKYTMTDDSTGVELPVSIVDVGVSQIDGQESYDTNIDLAPAYFGGTAEPTDVAGAQKAYVVINEQTQSPVLGMLVNDRFVLIQIGVEGSTVEQAQQLAAAAASRIA